MKCALFFPRFSGQSWIRRESCKYNLIKDNRRFCGFCEKNARVFIQSAVFMYKSAIQIFYKFARSVGVLVLPGARVPIGEGQARAIMGGFFRSSIRVSWLKKKILKKHVKFLVLGVLSEVLRELLSEHDMTPKNVSQARIGTCSHHKTSMM